MNARPPVDVLGMLDALALQTQQRGGSPSVSNIKEARDAMAKLIETSQALAEAIRFTPLGVCQLQALARLEASLARIGGAA